MAAKKSIAKVRTPRVALPSCKRVYRYICENLDTTVDSDECRAIKAHIADCPNCVAYLDTLKYTVTLYRLYPTPKSPASARRKVMARVKLAKRNR